MSPRAGKRSAVSLPSPPAVTPAKQCNNPFNLSSVGGQHPGTNQLCGHVPKLQVNPCVICPRTSAAMRGLLGCILAQMKPIQAWGRAVLGLTATSKPVEGMGLWAGQPCRTQSLDRAGHELGTRAHSSCYLHHKLVGFFFSGLANTKQKK